MFEQFERWELDAFAEGVDMPHVARVVKQHPEEWSQWLRAHHEADRPFSLLARFDCPSPLQLRDYFWSDLSAAEHARVAAHIQSCASCAEELQSLSAFVETEEPIEAATPAWSSSLLAMGQSLSQRLTQNIDQMVQVVSDRVRTVVATLVPPMLPQLAPVALRSGENLPTLNADTPTTLLFSAEEVDVSLVAMKETNGELFLSGQAFAAEALTGGKVTITPADQHLAAQELALDEAGAFVVGNVRPGYYQFVLSLSDRSIVIPNVLLQ